MKKVLVTGGAGFIGSNFVHLLMEERPEYHITVLDKLTYAGNLKNLANWKDNPRFTFIKADISDKDKIEEIFQKESFDYVVHFAAESHVDRSITGPEVFLQTNIFGTFYLLESIKKHWNSDSKEKRFLHVSTDEVYGSLGDSGFFTENTPYAPNSPYSASKASSDHLVRAYHHTYHLPVVTTNCSNNYGAYHFPEKLIPLMILNCLREKPLPVYGDGKNIRDWLFVKDHCHAILLVLEKGRIGESYNIGTRNEKNNLEIVETICSKMDTHFPDKKPHSRLITYVKDRPGHDFRYAIDPSKIESELGWKPKYDFDTAIQETIDWYIKNESWWSEILSGEYLQYYQNQYGLK
jgi:dTDP-glucose 4,6-dehydratase